MSNINMNGLYGLNIGNMPNWNSTDYLKNFKPVINGNNDISNSTTGLSGKLGKGLSTLSALGQAGAGLMNAFTAMKGLKLAKDQFRLEEAIARTNIANQAKLINNAIDASANIASQLSGSNVRGESYNKGLKDKFMSSANDRKVSGTIG